MHNAHSTWKICGEYSLDDRLAKFFLRELAAEGKQ